MNKHTARIDGEVIGTRNSKTRVYSHCVAVRGHNNPNLSDKERRGWTVVTWSGRLDLAQKQLDLWSAHVTEARILETSRNEPAALAA